MHIFLIWVYIRGPISKDIFEGLRANPGSYPSGLLLLLRWLSGRYPGLDIVITENGFCTPANDPEPIKDDVRVRYYQDHTRVVKEAVAEGLPLRGYFAWTLLDNFESW